jgi:predicted nucleotidyltransferase
MNECDRNILNQFAQQVRQKFPEAQIWAFGSRARGNAQPDSDLDICVVLETLNTASKKIISQLAWEVGFDNDLLITTVKYSRYQFEQGPCTVSPLVQAIHREGIAA